jgi:hypothetical protein
MTPVRRRGLEVLSLGLALGYAMNAALRLDSRRPVLAVGLIEQMVLPRAQP